MKINLIAALSQNRVIGKDGSIPWKIPGELKRFKKTTMGHPIIMGRKTFESIGKPLPGRLNIVLTRQENYKPEGVKVFRNLGRLKEMFMHTNEELFVIGGERPYSEFLPDANKLYLTFVNTICEGDAYFPYFEWSDFNIIEDEIFRGREYNPFEKRDEYPGYRYVVFERKKIKE